MSKDQYLSALASKAFLTVRILAPRGPNLGLGAYGLGLEVHGSVFGTYGSWLRVYDLTVHGLGFRSYSRVLPQD